MGKWYKLDNAAKIFPSVTNTKNTSVFRVSVLLNDEIDVSILQKAVDTIFDRFPAMTVRLRRGVFWNYLDNNTEKLYLCEEREYPCSMINPKENRGYLIKILYYKHRISVEVFHSITDGAGAIEFLKSLLYYYLKFLGHSIDSEDIILLAEDGASASELSDSFRNFYQKKSVVHKIEYMKAYSIKGNYFDNFGNNVIHGVLSASKLNAAAKAKGVTITAYLTALIIYSIWQTRMKYGTYDNPVIVAVPVNLRKYFPSRTLRNFFGVVNVGLRINKDIVFDELAKDIGESLKEKTGEQYLRNLIKNNLKFEDNNFTRFVPLFIKNIFVNRGFDVWGERKRTLTLSNMGNIILPKKMYEFINHFEFVLYPSKKSPINCAVCSSDDILNITFTRAVVETDIIQYFFSFLAEKEELDVKIYSNDWGKGDD
ncbi:hypothetical protein AGMMS49975_10980 [Clostridia bacterium]|nr:hypothetical protein AGMMS49975_10980 [Clostridia bacterium]